MGGGLLINGIDVATFGAHVAPGAPGQERSPDVLDLVLTADVGRMGDVLLDDGASLPDLARRIVLEIEQSTSTLLLAAIDQLKALCLPGQLHVAFGDRPTRLHRARCTAVEPIYPIGPAQGAWDAQVALTLSLSPVRYKCTALGQLDPTTLGLAVGVRTALPMGTAMSDLTFSVHGGGATLDGFTIVVRNAVGEEIFRMPFVGEVAAPESVSVSSAESSIRLVNGTGGAADAFALWDRSADSLANDFPELRPADANYAAALWATAELEVGAGGAPVGSVTYVEAYL